MARAPRKKLEESVALAGAYSEQRLRALQTGVDRFRRAPGLPAVIRGPVRAARRVLRDLPQMGEGGAHRMLLFGAHHAVLPVDAAVGRVAARLGYGAQAANHTITARSIRVAVAAELPAEPRAFRRAFLYLSHHGIATCTPTNPHCPVCPLLGDCPDGQRALQVS
jgi:endonuclease-3